MTTTPTQLPVPSEKPQDLKFNAGKIDEFVTSMGWTYTDRFGVKHYTIEGIRYIAEQGFAAQLLSQEQRFNLFIQNSGYQVIGDYEDGPLTITEYNQLIRYDNELWKLKAATDIPFTTTGNDAISWVVDSVHFVSVGDAALRQNLLSDEVGLGDELLTVKQPFTGAVGRSQHEKNADVRSVKDFGAKGDGVTDDTQSFLDAGKGSYVPAGIYKIDGDIPDHHAYHGEGRTLVKGLLTKLGGLGELHVQKELMEINFGGYDNPIYAGAQNALQNIAPYLADDGSTQYFLHQRVEGATWSKDEYARLTHLDAFGNPTEFTGLLQLGHGGNLDVQIEGGQLYIYSSQTTSDSSVYSGRGITRVKWNGTATTQADVETFYLFSPYGSGGRFDYLRYGVGAISTDGRYIVTVAISSIASGRFFLVYDKAEVLASTDPNTLTPLFGPVPIQSGHGLTGRVMQGVTCDGKYVYIIWGSQGPRGPRSVCKYSMQGELLYTALMSGPMSKFTDDEIQGLTPMGVPASFEPEGIAVYDGKLYITFVEGFRAAGQVVTWGGYNWMNIASSNLNNSPPDANNWVLTTAPATDGAWSSTVTYANTIVNYSRKYIWNVSDIAENGMTEMGHPLMTQPPEASANGRSYTGVSYPYGAYFNLVAQVQQTNETLNTFSVTSNGSYRFQNPYLSVADRERFASLNVNSDYTSVFGYGNTATVSSYVRFSHPDNASTPNEVNIAAVGSAGVRLSAGGGTAALFGPYSDAGTGSYCSIVWRPGTDGTIALGRSVNPWSTAYLKTAPVITSDERLKLERQGGFDDLVLDAWSAVDFKQYALLQSAYEEGAEARWHFGVFAQRICQAFTDRGLDWKEYNIVTYVEWDAEPATYDEFGKIETEAVPAGNRYHVAYDEAYAIECALNRRERAKLEERIAALEAALTQ